MLVKILNIHFGAFKMRSAIAFMTYKFYDVNVTSKKRHVITERRTIFKVKTERSYALLLSKFKVFQTPNQNVGN